MTTEEVAKKVVELVRKQAWYEALDLYDEEVVSVEGYPGAGGSPQTGGKDEASWATNGSIEYLQPIRSRTNQDDRAVEPR